MNYGEISINILKQIIFFVLNLYFIPSIITLFTKSNSPLSEKLNHFIAVAHSWTIDLVCNILEFIVSFLTGYIVYSSIHIEIVEFSKAPKIVSLRPYWKNRWFLVTIPFAKYITVIITHVILPLVAAIFSLKFLLPQTFAQIADSIGQWTSFSTGTPNLDFFVDMWNVFRDIAWNGLVTGGLSENVLSSILCLCIFLICTGTWPVLHDKDEPAILGENIVLWVFFSILIAGYNIIHAHIDFTGYTTVAQNLDSIGMILLLALIVKLILEAILWSGKKILRFIFNGKK